MLGKILCVDDDAEMLEVLKEMLEHEGFPVIACLSAKEAISRCEHSQGTPVAIVSDFSMPEMDGLEFRAAIYPIFPEVPFFIASGFISDEMVAHGQQLHITGFFGKPFDIREMANAIKKTFGNDTVQSLGGGAAEPESSMSVSRLLRSIDWSLIGNQDLGKETLRKLRPQLEELSQVGSSELPFGTLAIQRVLQTLGAVEAALSGNVAEDERILERLRANIDALKDFCWKDLSRPQTTEVETPDALAIRTAQVEEAFGRIEKKFAAPSLSASKANESLANAASVQPSQAPNAAAAGAAQIAKSAEPNSVVKVDSKILDQFLENAGELTVVRNIVNKITKDLERKYPLCESVTLLAEMLYDMHKLTTEVQNKIQELRLVSVGELCKTLPRVSRDLGKKLGKQLEVKVEGGEVLIDGAQGRVLNECLVHLLRNSADHGIESNESRAEKGKPKHGTIRVRAEANADGVVVYVSDDGKGIDPAVVGKKAVEKGLLTAKTLETMTPQKIQELIFQAGFSTADAVSDVSGRGVGMDMVYNGIRDLGGQVQLQSVLGQGTSFKMSLPNVGKANIINALLVESGSEVFAIPQAQVVRAYELSDEALIKCTVWAGGVQLFCNKSESLLPIVSLSQLLNLDRKSEKVCRTFIELESQDFHFCMEVDAFIDTEEIVTRKCSALCGGLSIFLGVTFIGVDGLCLIIDVEKLAKMAGLSLKDGRQNLRGEFSNSVEAESMAHSSGKPTTNEHILIRTLSGERMALDLLEVDRLERWPSEAVSSTPQGRIAIYQGAVTPIVPLESHANLSFVPQVCGQLATKERLALLALRRDSKWKLLEVDEILDAFQPREIQSIESGQRFALWEKETIPILELGLLGQKVTPEIPAGVTESLGESDGIFWAV